MCFARAPHDPLADHTYSHEHGGGHHGCPCPDGGDVMMDARRPDIPSVITVEDVAEKARELTSVPDYGRSPSTGFVGFGGIEDGDEVLLVSNDHYDDIVVEGVKQVLEEQGAEVNQYVFHKGGDRELTETDEVEVIMRREPFAENPRRYDYGPYEWTLDHAEDVGYDAMIQGFGGPIPDTPFRMEAFPWMEAEDFVSPATSFPHELNHLINKKVWNLIYREGRDGTVHLTDPEGTDITFTLHSEYMERDTMGYTETPIWGHLHGHSPPPLLEKEDATGVIAGTTSHFNRPFPRMKLHIEDAVVVDIEGGGAYGDAWRALLEETQDTRYPDFPRDGLFQWWECAIGTNPLVHRPKRTMTLSGGGMERERNRSGVIHCGFGTRWRGESEKWAGERGHPYGHLHVHLLFPTYEIDVGNKTMRIIEDGHLTMLDDPEVRELASKYGDPDELLSERWIPDIPGISTPGTYEDYARDPYSVVDKQLSG